MRQKATSSSVVVSEIELSTGSGSAHEDSVLLSLKQFSFFALFSISCLCLW
uniref:Uncharacterized protein n=1 Tax=Rhizophora mucronata TaxID=61149 RepID=A0A2P2R481_RHIMU